MYTKASLFQAFLAASGVGLASAACPAVGGTFTVEGVCNVASVKSVCPDVTDEAARIGCQDASVKFEDIAGNHYQYDKEFMDGGTVLNDIQASELPVDVGRIAAAVQNVASDNVIAWPEYEARAFYEETNLGGVQGGAYMTNFDLDGSCDLRTVVCCYVDNANGVFDDNTDVCYQDLHQARRSNRVSNGYSTFSAGDPTHCIGFTWEEGEESDALKGNALFHISYKYRMESGYAKNVPGAPMCACIEQMPTIEKAACADVSGTSTFTFTYNSANSITGTNTASVTYGDCDGDDLKSYYAGTGAEKAELDKYLVGDGGCTEATTNFLNDMFLVPTDEQLHVVDSDKWAAFSGYGLNMYLPFDKKNYATAIAEKDVELRGLLADAPEQIIYRHCKYCKESHKHIYYKRITDWPEDFNIANLFLGDWLQAHNNRGEDFNLYSTYEDAINDENAWTYCNYSSTYGFPLDCGPTGFFGCQWTSYKRGMCHDARAAMFYVLK